MIQGNISNVYQVKKDTKLCKWYDLNLGREMNKAYILTGRKREQMSAYVSCH